MDENVDKVILRILIRDVEVFIIFIKCIHFHLHYILTQMMMMVMIKKRNVVGIFNQGVIFLLYLENRRKSLKF